MSKTSSSSAPARPGRSSRLLRIAIWGGAIAAAGALVLLITAGIAVVLIYPKLPNISELSDYRPKLPLRVFSSEGILIGEFGEERRNLTPISDIPKVMKDAVLAVGGRALL